MIPGLAIAMRVIATVWFALALAWSSSDAWAHAAVTFAIGAACFAYAEWLDRRTTTSPAT